MKDSLNVNTHIFPRDIRTPDFHTVRSKGAHERLYLHQNSIYKPPFQLWRRHFRRQGNWRSWASTSSWSMLLYVCSASHLFHLIVVFDNMHINIWHSYCTVLLNVVPTYPTRSSPVVCMYVVSADLNNGIHTCFAIIFFLVICLIWSVFRMTTSQKGKTSAAMETIFLGFILWVGFFVSRVWMAEKQPNIKYFDVWGKENLENDDGCPPPSFTWYNAPRSSILVLACC